MSDCCSNTHAKISLNCPLCGSVCKSVEMRTVYHQLRFPENQGVAADTYFFCPTKHCSIGYFSIAGNTVPKQLLSTYQEIQDDKLCYCFDIDAGDYLASLRSHPTGSSIKNFVIQRTKSGDCACEIRNPSGQCCLGKFKDLEKRQGTIFAISDRSANPD